MLNLFTFEWRVDRRRGKHHLGEFGKDLTSRFKRLALSTPKKRTKEEEAMKEERRHQKIHSTDDVLVNSNAKSNLTAHRFLILTRTIHRTPEEKNQRSTHTDLLASSRC
jgi:hypothetical protein